MGKLSETVISTIMGNTLEIVGQSAAAWTAANPIVPLGGLVSETDTGVIRFGNGTSHYLDLSSGIRTARQTAQVTNSSNVNFADITGLVLSVQSGHLYEFAGQLTCQTDLSTAGPLFGITGPTLSFGRWSVTWQIGATGTSHFATQSTTFGSTAGYASGTFSVGANADFSVIIQGKFQPSADGTVQLKLRSSTNGQVMTVKNEGLIRLVDCGV